MKTESYLNLPIVDMAAYYEVILWQELNGKILKLGLSAVDRNSCWHYGTPGNTIFGNEIMLPE